MTRDLLHAGWYEAFLQPNGSFRAACVLLIVTLVAAIGWIVYSTGGTAYVYAHSIYVPILFAAMVFNVPGAVLTALVAGLMLGPFMPLYVDGNIPQDTINWIYRTGFLAVIGAFAGVLFSALQSQLTRMRRLAFEDVETHLPNRLSLEADVRQRMSSIADDHGQRQLYLVSIQISNYQRLVSTLGPAFGRRLLKELAGELDSVEHAAYRLSTDCFALLLSDTTRISAENTVERTLRMLARPRIVDDVPVHVDASAGMAAAPIHESDNPEGLIRKCIQAQRIARETDRSWRAYDRERDEAQQQSLAMLGDLRPALDRGELELHYQPKVNVATGEVAGFEALIRWRHPERGMVPPGMFIPGAEQTGLIHPLTRWVLESALNQLRHWRDQGISTKVAVNLSGRNLMDAAFLGWALSLIDEYELAPGSIEFELTENSLFSDAKGMVNELASLRDARIGLAIDDFGTGYSSLSYLEQLPVTALKIDRSFIAKLEDRDGTSAKIVRASIHLAQNLGIRAVAEGVETAGVVDVLADLECDELQGYFCARPMPAAEIGPWWTANGGVWSS